MSENYDASTDPNYVDELLVGRINLKDIGECNVKIYGREIIIPRFHIMNSNFHTSICIHSNNYFPYGPDKKYCKNILDEEQRKELDKWLDESNCYFTLYKNWDVLRLLWETTNPDIKFPESKKALTKPDYTTIENFKP